MVILLKTQTTTIKNHLGMYKDDFFLFPPPTQAPLATLKISKEGLGY